MNTRSLIGATVSPRHISHCRRRRTIALAMSVPSVRPAPAAVAVAAAAANPKRRSGGPNVAAAASPYAQYPPSVVVSNHLTKGQHSGKGSRPHSQHTAAHQSTTDGKHSQHKPHPPNAGAGGVWCVVSQSDMLPLTTATMTLRRRSLTPHPRVNPNGSKQRTPEASERSAVESMDPIQLWLPPAHTRYSMI